MSQGVYKIIEMVGSSPVSWEEAAQNAVKSAGLSLRDLRIAEIITMDMIIEEGKGIASRFLKRYRQYIFWGEVRLSHIEGGYKRCWIFDGSR